MTNARIALKGFAAVLAALVAWGTASAATRPLPEYPKSAVVYQLVLRNVTR